MKLLNNCFVLVVLCGVIQLCHGERFKCFFSNWSAYLCEVTSLVNTNNNLVIDGHSGVHETNKTDTDVKLLWIRDTNTKFIPRNIGLLFNLTVLMMFNTQLVQIKSKDFNGMQNLEDLSLYNNKLTSVPIDAFSTLTKLKKLELMHNQLELIPNGVFSNNLQLEGINLRHNKIKFLGSSLFDGLTKLNYVNLKGNICINNGYEGSSAIIQLKQDIQRQCINPNESTASITTQIPTEASNMTTQNPTDATTTVLNNDENESN